MYTREILLLINVCNVTYLYLLRMLCQLRLLINFNYTPLLCHYGMLVCSAKIIVLLTVHAFGASFPSLLQALRESPPGGEPQAAVKDDGD